MVGMREHLRSVIERGLEKGFRPDYIRSVLLSKGYDAQEVDWCLSQVRPPDSQTTPDVRVQRSHTSHHGSRRRQQPPYAVYTLGVICILLFIGLVYFASLPAKVIEVEKIIEVPVGAQLSEDEDLRSRLDSYATLSDQLDEKQRVIDEQLAQITGLSINVDEQEHTIEQQVQELQELNTLMKEERKEVVSLLVEVLNYILGQAEYVRAPK